MTQQQPSRPMKWLVLAIFGGVTIALFYRVIQERHEAPQAIQTQK